MSQQDLITRATEVQARYTDMLMSMPHVQGVAVGLAKRDGEYTNEIAIVVLVDIKVPEDQLAPEDRIPAALDGVPVDVQEIGIVTAQ